LPTGQYLWSSRGAYQVAETEKDSLQETRGEKRALTQVSARGMKKYEMYLPLKYNDGREIEAEKIKQIREELIAAFGALTVSSHAAPYQGRWKYGGVEFVDDIIKIEIITSLSTSCSLLWVFPFPLQPAAFFLILNFSFFIHNSLQPCLAQRRDMTLQYR
jgi:hypothetical protein